MSTMPTSTTVSLLLRMLREGFEGPPGPWTYFSDVGPGTGLFGTIGGLTLADVSRPAGSGRSTIAGHLEHVSASLALATREVQGEATSRDRTQSWTVSMVDAAAWDALRARLQREYERLVLAVRTRAAWDEATLGAAMGAIAHAAYHLGAIRQRLALLETTPPEHGMGES